jgi:hypothetical protein
LDPDQNRGLRQPRQAISAIAAAAAERRPTTGQRPKRSSTMRRSWCDGGNGFDFPSTKFYMLIRTMITILITFLNNIANKI